MSEPLHREFFALRTTTWLLVALGFGLIVIEVATDSGFRGMMYLTGILTLLLAWLAWGIYRYNRILLTADTLIVGDEKFTPTDFDRWFDVQPPVVLHPDEQARVEGETPLPSNAEIRIAGGSYGRRLTTRMVVLREADTQRLVVIFSRHPMWLSRLLTRWLAELPLDGS